MRAMKAIEARGRRQNLSRATLVIALGLLVVAASGCGSPAQQSSVVPASPAMTISPPDATATALFEAVNTKLGLNNEPTLVPGTNPLNPLANATHVPAATDTPGPSPTPEAPQCGATISGWPEILQQYGPLQKGNGCGPIDDQLIITTSGISGGPGAIATYQCAAGDASCLRGQSPTAGGAAWSVFPAPYPGSVTIIGGSGANLIIDNGGRQICFDLTTHTYDPRLGCHG